MDLKLIAPLKRLNLIDDKFCLHKNLFLEVLEPSCA